jgi:hypothetical protein
MSSEILLPFVTGLRMLNDMPKKKMPKDVKDYFARMGRKGGLLGGKARAANLTVEQRRASAKKAVEARWAKAKASRREIT